MAIARLHSRTEVRTPALAAENDEFFALARGLQRHPGPAGKWSPHVGAHFQAVWGRKQGFSRGSDLGIKFGSFNS